MIKPHYIMKNYIPFLAIALVLGACQDEPQGALETLRARRDSLKTEHGTLAAEIDKLESQIALLDSSQQITRVSANKIEGQTFEHFFTSQANLEAEFNALVYPEISGVVTAIFVEEGQKVTKGQSILQIDIELIRKQIAEVETQYVLAEDIYNRQKNLWDQKIGSEIQYLQAKANKEALENSIATIRKQLSKGTVTAPFSGVIDEIIPRIGEMGNPGMPVVRVINLSELYIKADVSENYLTTLKEGMVAEVVFPGVDTLAATISRIGSYINPENRTFKVRVDLKESSPYLKPNLFATLRIKDFVADTAVVLPSGSILQDFSGDNYVFVLKNPNIDPKAQKRFIKTGLSYDGNTHILEGLSPGELIIDKGARKVIDGEQVKVMTDKEKLANK